MAEGRRGRPRLNQNPAPSNEPDQPAAPSQNLNNTSEQTNRIEEDEDWSVFDVSELNIPTPTDSPSVPLLDNTSSPSAMATSPFGQTQRHLPRSPIVGPIDAHLPDHSPGQLPASRVGPVLMPASSTSLGHTWPADLNDATGNPTPDLQFNRGSTSQPHCSVEHRFRPAPAPVTKAQGSFAARWPSLCF